MVNISFDLNHPAHYLFFRNILKSHEILGFNPIIFIQEKDRLKNLLLDDSLRFYSRINQGNTISRLSLLPKDIIQMRNILKKEEVKINVGKSSTIGTIAAKSLKCKTIVFDDTDNSKLEIELYKRFADEILYPEGFPFKSKNAKIKTFKGLFPLAYLSPTVFTPKKSIVESLGLLERGKPILIRIIDYNASHDWKYRGHRENFTKIVKELDKDYDLLLSIEGKEYPKSLKPYIKQFKAKDYHHILAFSKLYIGSGASTAQEASVLGVPSVYTNPIIPFYIKILKNRYRMIKIINENNINVENIQDFINSENWKSRKEFLLNDMIDMPKFLENYFKKVISQIESWSSNITQKWISLLFKGDNVFD